MARRESEAAVVAAAYRLDLDADAWLNEIARATRPYLDQGLGVQSGTFWAPEPSEQRILEVGCAGCDPEVPVRLGRIHAQLALAHSENLYRTFVTGSPTTASQARDDDLLDALPELDAVDLLLIRAGDSSGYAVGLGVLLTKRQAYPHAFLRHWTRLANHLAAGYRLRRALTSHHSSKSSHVGRAEHHTGRGSDSLRALATAVDRTRAREGSDPKANLTAWHGLSRGRWSLVARFEENGRRYLIARRNEGQDSNPEALTPRERKVLSLRAAGESLKAIAYEVGLSNSSVARALEAAKFKLGFESDSDLASLETRLESTTGPGDQSAPDDESTSAWSTRNRGGLADAWKK